MNETTTKTETETEVPSNATIATWTSGFAVVENDHAVLGVTDMKTRVPLLLVKMGKVGESVVAEVNFLARDGRVLLAAGRGELNDEFASEARDLMRAEWGEAADFVPSLFGESIRHLVRYRVVQALQAEGEGK